MIDDRVFIFSSFKNNPEFFFQGYCFVGRDYIYGQQGAEKYESTENVKIDFDEDGCYVLMRREKDEYLFGCDYSGYKKIFYYFDSYSKNWIVSNSINLIVKLMDEMGLTYTPNYSQLNAIVLNKNFNQQLTSFNTPVKEIKLLPPNTYLRITNNYFSIDNCKNDLLVEIENISYEEIIHQYLEVWASRYLTIVSEKDMTINQDLTGGIDSRAIFSLTHMANKNVSSAILKNQRLISRVSRGDTIDYDIAKEITTKYNYDLQSSIPNEENLITAEESYHLWKNINLGNYHPIYFPVNNMNPLITKFNGAGGGNYSPYYASGAKNYSKNRFELYINQFTNNLKYPFLGQEYKSDIAKDTNYIYSRIGNDSIEKLTLHYNKFRNRFHGGMIPQYTVCFTPLSSKYLDYITHVSSKEKIDSAQIMYDLINVTEGLLSLRYDFYEKNPKEMNIENIFNLKRELDVRKGSTYYDAFKYIEEKKLGIYSNPMDYLYEDFGLACKKDFVSRFWGKEFIDNAEKILVKNISNNQFNHGRDAIALSAIMASSWF